MKTRKLACQGCVADIDPVPGQKYINCGYCATTNVLESDAAELPAGAAPPQAPPGAVQIPQVQIRLPSGPSGAEFKKAGKIVALVVLSVVIAFVGIGVTVFWRFSRSVAHGGGRSRTRTPITVELLSLTTGKSKWTHTLSDGSSVRGVVVTAKRVFIRQGSWIQILDVATGKPPVPSSTSGAALPAP